MKITTLLWTCAIMILLVPAAFAVNVGSGITPGIETEDYVPQVFMCDQRIVLDDATEPGRITGDGDNLTERIQNYAFEGEQIKWEVLVFDKNGIQKVEDVYATVGDSQGVGNDIEVNCVQKVLPNITIIQDGTAAYWDCTLTVETPQSMYGEHWITVEAIDLDGITGVMDEHEYWFLNPVVALSITGGMAFNEVRPGTHSYSETLLIGNDADEGSGVMLDMFISGTDFYDTTNSGAACPTTNQLLLGDGDSDCDYDVDPFCYHATNGAYSTQTDPRNDVEGYVGIDYGIGFNDPKPFYDSHEIIQGAMLPGGYYAGNVLAPGAEMALTFRLNLPEPCNGDFDTGSVYFWGEAI